MPRLGKQGALASLLGGFLVGFGKTAFEESPEQKKKEEKFFNWALENQGNKDLPLSTQSKIDDFLGDAFGVDVGDIIINESLEPYGIEASYIYAGDSRFTLQLMGCNADDDLCSWGQSASATRLMMDNSAEWGEVVG